MKKNMKKIVQTFNNIDKFFQKWLSKPKFMIDAKKSLLNNNFVIEFIVAVCIWKAYSLTSSEFENLLIYIFNKFYYESHTIFLVSCSILIFFALFYVIFIERRKLYTMGLIKKDISIEIFYGILVGIIVPCSNLLPYMLFGMKLDFCSPNFFLIFINLILYILQGTGEELFFRGYLMTSLSKKYSLTFAIISSSIFFGLLHGGSPINVIEQMMMGMIFAIYTVKRGNIYGTCIFHGINNFMLVNYFGGYEPSIPSVFSVNFSNWSGNVIFDSGAWIIIQALIIMIVMFFIKEKKKRNIK